LNKVANNYWVDRRLGSQRVTARSLPRFPQVPDFSREISGAVARVQRESRIIPAGVIFGMVLLATLAVCATVTMRSRAELQNSSRQYQSLNVELNDLVRGNAALRAEVRHLQSDPGVIESAARARLNMVRPKEIVVPLETSDSNSQGER
jgi:cell division protein FtsB